MITHPTDKEICFPHAKINIGLYVTSRRPDGYHTLQSLFYPIGWRDALEIIPEGAAGSCRFTLTGLHVDGAAEDNLCVKAYRRLHRLFPDLPGVHIHLEKKIPFGAGLGGGSSDASHTLLSLRRLFSLPLSDQDIEREAAMLGADCPFFCRTGAQYLTDGIGAELTPSPFSLAGRWLVVVKPPIYVSTRDAFARITPRYPATPLAMLLTLPIEQWRDRIGNDFERSLFPLHPALADIKTTLYDHGALYASMSGSGSALFGIFDHRPSNPSLWFPQDHDAMAMPAEV